MESVTAGMASMARGRSLGLVILLLTASTTHRFCQASQHRSLFNEGAGTDNSGPEDLLLEELVRNWKWAVAQREAIEDVPIFEGRNQESAFREQTVSKVKPVHADHQLQRAEQLQRADQPQQVQRQHHHKFAYRPHEAGFGGTWQNVDHNIGKVIEPPSPPAASQVQHANDVRIAGQKEHIFDEVPAMEDKFPSVASKSSIAEVASDPKHTKEPVAHAMVSSPRGGSHQDSLTDIYLTALVAGCTASAVAAILALGVCFYRWQRRAKSAQDVEYPAYGITGPGPSPSGKSSLKSSPTSSIPGGLGSWGAKSPKAASGDKKLAHSAHMFHFQHQKQQVIAMESHSGCERRGSNSGGESDEDNEEGDYTVYECPGLAPTGEMEVKNPLFLDDPTPASPAMKRQSE